MCDGDGQGRVHRLPFVSHGCGQSSSPRYRCMLNHVLHVACQVMSSCFFVFPVPLKVGVEHLPQGPDKFLPRKLCASFCCGCSCAFVCIVSYAAGHIKECVTEMVRVKSTDSPLSATAGVKTPPQGTGVCILACQVRLPCFCRFPAQLKVGVECLTQGPEKFLSRKVCAFLVWLQLCMFVVSYAAGHRKGWDRWSGSSPRTPLCQPWLGQSSSPRYRCM